MIVVGALKHVELWQAGSAADRQPAAFETGAIEDTLCKAAMVYGNVPVEDVVAVERSLTEVGRAIDTRGRAGFDAGYGSITKACNGCRQAANVGFSVVKTPNARQPDDQKL